MKKLYKKDAKGKIREWSMEIDGANYRTISGLIDGQKVTTEWTTAFATNVGRANARDPNEQAQFEVDAEYTKKLRMGYFETPEAAESEVFIKPMLATKYDPNKSLPKDIWVQPKLDGIRALVYQDKIMSRTNKEIVSCPHILESLQPFFEKHPGVILDGELYNHDLKDDFQKITSVVKKLKLTPENLEESKRLVQFHVYDAIMEDDTSFFERGNLVFNMKTYEHVVPVETVGAVDDDDKSEYYIHTQYARFMEDGYEGMMIRVESPYEQKRSKSLQKYKSFQDQEFKIVDVLEGKGNWAGMAKTVKVINDQNNGELFSATIKGSQEYCRTVLENKEKYIGNMATVEFFERSNDGVPRFPIAKILHDGERL